MFQGADNKQPTVDIVDQLRARIAQLQTDLTFCRESFAGTETALRQEVALQRCRVEEIERQTSACVAHWQEDCQRLNAENQRLRADADLLKDALRWCLDKDNWQDYRYGHIDLPPRFAAVIAEAIKDSTKGPTNV